MYNVANMADPEKGLLPDHLLTRKLNNIVSGTDWGELDRAYYLAGETRGVGEIDTATRMNINNDADARLALLTEDDGRPLTQRVGVLYGLRLDNLPAYLRPLEILKAVACDHLATTLIDPHGQLSPIYYSFFKQEHTVIAQEYSPMYDSTIKEVVELLEESHMIPEYDSSNPTRQKYHVERLASWHESSILNGELPPTFVTPGKFVFGLKSLIINYDNSEYNLPWCKGANFFTVWVHKSIQKKLTL